MGIKGLRTLLRRFAPDCYQTRNIEYYRGSTIAIDTSILLYKLAYKEKKTRISILESFVHRLLFYLKYEITPIFVLDGTPPPEKSFVLDKRYRVRTRLKERILLEQDPIKKAVLENKLIVIPKQVREDLKKLFSSLGVQYIQAEGESETLCAYLQKRNLVDFTYTEDSDALVFGCDNIIYSDGNMIKQINLSMVLRSLGLSYPQFVDLSILIGCDYCSPPLRINPVIAYEYIQEYGTLERIAEAYPANYRDAFRARQLFLATHTPCLPQKRQPTIFFSKAFCILEKYKVSRKKLFRLLHRYENLVQRRSVSQE